MKCPGDAEHEGLRVIKLDPEITPHYAKAMCAECGVWIKWLSKRQWVEIHVDGIAEDKAEVYGVDLSAAFEKAIREIVRDEIKKMAVEGCVDCVVQKSVDALDGVD